MFFVNDNESPISIPLAIKPIKSSSFSKNVTEKNIVKKTATIIINPERNSFTFGLLKTYFWIVSFVINFQLPLLDSAVLVFQKRVRQIVNQDQYLEPLMMNW